MEKLKILEEILKYQEISEFSQTWIENSKTTANSIRETYGVLKRLGLTNDKIVTNAQLLGGILKL